MGTSLSTHCIPGAPAMMNRGGAILLTFFGIQRVTPEAYDKISQNRDIIRNILPEQIECGKYIYHHWINKVGVQKPRQMTYKQGVFAIILTLLVSSDHYCGLIIWILQTCHGLNVSIITAFGDRKFKLLTSSIVPVLTIRNIIRDVTLLTIIFSSTSYQDNMNMDATQLPNTTITITISSVLTNTSTSNSTRSSTASTSTTATATSPTPTVLY